MLLLILGANSDIALATAARFARDKKADLILASRDLDRLGKRAHDLEARFGVKAETLFFDAMAYATHRSFYESLDPKPDAVLLAFGYGGNQRLGRDNFEEIRRIIETNYLGAVSILEIIAADFEKRGRGVILAISSVAGERGRASNYLYGSAKGGLTTYLSGLRSRSAGKGVRVTTILPGFVRTKMTEELDLPKRLTAEPDRVAADIVKAFEKGKDVVYTPLKWRLIMAVIKAVPEQIFKRLRI